MENMRREGKTEGVDTYFPYEEDRDKQNRVTVSPFIYINALFTPMRIFYAVVVLLLAFVLPVVLYVVMSDTADFTSKLWTCNVGVENRISCQNPTVSLDEDACINLGCCWDKENLACFHSLPSQHSYKIDKWNNTALTEIETNCLNLTPRIPKCLYANQNAVNLRARVVSISQGYILRFYLYDNTTNEPVDTDTTALSSSQFKVQVLGPEYFSVQINRNKEGTFLFSTSPGPTIACDDYWELALQFPNDAAVFGLGALRLTSKPKILYNSGYRLGANPFIMILDNNGEAHGILFNNKGPMEFQLLENSNILSVKSRSSVMWDISVFAGPDPTRVMEQYTSMDGLRPILPSAWALGVHICRDTERQNENLVADDAFYFLQNAAERELPYESDCLQEGLLYGLKFSTSANMTNITQEFTETGRKLLLSLVPHFVSSPDEPDEELFVFNGTERLQEKFRGQQVSYPDFFNDKWQEIFSCNIDNLPNDIEPIVGGFVLQDNWPASTTTYNTTEDMQVAEGPLSTGTLWWKYLHGNDSHYWFHNEYGLRHAKLVKLCPIGPELVLSAATHTGVGAVGGCHAHTQTDVIATWNNMKIALQTALGLGLAGIPLSGGGSVCGTMGSYDEELCIRWYLMSSVLPLMRVSSGGPLRDPVNLPSEYSRQAAKSALELRYSLLAYFHSLFHEANSRGVPVARPIFFDFPADKLTWTIDEQFMIGPALMASPVFYKDAVTVPVYLPNDTVWYHFISGHQLDGTGEAVSITSLRKELVLLLRGGYIVPYQKPNLTVDKTLAGPYNLVVGLRYKENDTCFADGSLYTGSASSQKEITFTATETELVINGSCSKCILQNVSVYGLRATFTSCTIVRPNEKGKCTVKEQKGVIEISELQSDLSNIENFTIEWKFETKKLATERTDK